MTVSVNDKLREVMDWYEISQQTLAERTGIPRSTINSYVIGRRIISVEVAYQLAPALGVSPWTLLNGEALLATPLDLSEEEARLVTRIRSLTLDHKEVVLAVMETLEKQSEKNRKNR